MKTPKSSNRGFTLIELLVVIAIIGILASVIISSVNEARKRSKITKAKADLYSLNTALMMLTADTGKWINGCPPGEISNEEATLIEDENDLTKTAGIMNKPSVGAVGNKCAWTEKEVAQWSGPYATDAIDPWGNSYFFDPDYCIGDNIQVSTLSSYGPNGKLNYGPNCTMNSAISVANPDDIIYVLEKSN